MSKEEIALELYKIYVDNTCRFYLHNVTDDYNEILDKVSNDTNQIENLNKEISYLNQQLEENHEKFVNEMANNVGLELKIRKAIEFVEEHKFKGKETINTRYLDNELSEDLLEILKGE